MWNCTQHLLYVSAGSMRSTHLIHENLVHACMLPHRHIVHCTSTVFFHKGRACGSLASKLFLNIGKMPNLPPDLVVHVTLWCALHPETRYAMYHVCRLGFSCSWALCVHACVRACVRVCVRACVRACKVECGRWNVETPLWAAPLIFLVWCIGFRII